MRAQDTWRRRAERLAQIADCGYRSAHVVLALAPAVRDAPERHERLGPAPGESLAAGVDEPATELARLLDRDVAASRDRLAESAQLLKTPLCSTP